MCAYNDIYASSVFFCMMIFAFEMRVHGTFDAYAIQPNPPQNGGVICEKELYDCDHFLFEPTSLILKKEAFEITMLSVCLCVSL
jgi:hypothetical protein